MAKRALLVGINRYPDPRINLRGCVNDVLQTSAVLQAHYGFAGGDAIRLLTDERATGDRIRARLGWLVEGAVPGDVLVFQYSGHGSQVRDRDDDELEDGLDEIICPYDHDWDHPFTDDELGACLGAMPEGVNLTVILDCCHAGTGLRDWKPALPIQRRSLVPPADVRHRENLLVQDCGPNRRVTLTTPREPLPLTRFGTVATQRGAVLIAACAANQVSADAWIDGDYHGALTWCLWRAAADTDYQATYEALVRRTRALLRAGGFEQVAQLEAERGLRASAAFAPLALQATA